MVDGVEGLKEWKMVWKGRKSGKWCGRLERVGNGMEG